jgi:hypothetical protein
MDLLSEAAAGFAQKLGHRPDLPLPVVAGFSPRVDFTTL